MRILFCDDDFEVMSSLRKMVLEYFKAIGQPEPECVLCSSGGELDGGLYFIVNYQSEKADWQKGDSDEVNEHNGSELKRVTVAEYKRLDLDTLEISEWELPKKIVRTHEKRDADGIVPFPIYAQIKEGAAIYSDGTDTLIVNPGGKEVFLEGVNCNDMVVANGYIFDSLATGDNTARRRA